MSTIALHVRRCMFCSTIHRPTRLLLRPFSSSNPTTGFSYPGARSLEQIVKLELLQTEPLSEIRKIWKTFHADKRDAAATTLGASAFNELIERATGAPYAVIPVYRQQGYFTLLSQFQQSCFLVTSLEAFKQDASTAPPCVAISLYDNLVVDKDIALIRADVSNLLDKHETQRVLQQVLHSYLSDDLYDHVHTFNNQPHEFDFEAFRLLLLQDHNDQHLTEK